MDELASIFRNTEDPVGAAKSWGKLVLRESGIDPHRNPMKALKKLRDEEPALNLETANYLIKKLTASN